MQKVLFVIKTQIVFVAFTLCNYDEYMLLFARVSENSLCPT